MIVGREQQVLCSLAVIRARQAHISAPRFAVNRLFGADWPLKEVVKNTLKSGRDLDHQRAVVFQIDLAHRIDDIRIGRRHQCFGVQAIFENRQYVVACAEGLFGAVFHPVHIEHRQCPEVALYCSLKNQLVLKLLDGPLTWISPGNGMLAS